MIVETSIARKVLGEFWMGRANFARKFEKVLALDAMSRYYIQAAFFEERDAAPLEKPFTRRRVIRPKNFSKILKKVLDGGEAVR